MKLTIGVLIWIFITFMGFAQLLIYSNTPAKKDTDIVISPWPATSKIKRIEHTPTLLLFLHPECPCSQATVEELQRIMLRLEGIQASVITIFYKPKSKPTSWVQNSLWKKVEANSRIRTFIDEDAEETTIFDAEVSGETLLFNESGNLVFRGGITPSRGHQGDNPGEDFIIRWFRGARDLAFTQTSIFGCRIRDQKIILVEKQKIRGSEYAESTQ